MKHQLTGISEVRVDDRNRVAIPARLLEDFTAIASSAEGEGSASEGPLDVVVGLGMGIHLCVFPQNVYQKLLDYLDQKPSWDNSWNKIRSNVVGTAEVQTLDKQNRFRIPALLAKKLGLAGEIVVKGVKDHLELVSMEEWASDFDQYRRDFDSLIQEATRADREA